MTIVMTITLTFNRSYDSLTIDEKSYTYDGNNKWHFDYNDIFYKKIEGGGGSLGGGGGTTKYMDSFQAYRDTLTSITITIVKTSDTGPTDTLNIDTLENSGVFADFNKLISFTINFKNIDNNISNDLFDTKVYFGDNTFFNCTALSTVNLITFPSSSNPIILSNSMFLNCTSLSNITGLGKIRSIETGCFQNCTNLQNINISDNINNIYDSAFFNCINLETINIIDKTNNIGINLPSQLQNISTFLFTFCKKIQQINIPPTINTINIFAFIDCINLSTVNFIGNSTILAIPVGCFFRCINLSNISLPSSITSIGAHAFGGCTNLATINSLNITLNYIINQGIFSGTKLNYMNNTMLSQYYTSIINQNISFESYNKDYFNFILKTIYDFETTGDIPIQIYFIAKNIIQYYNIKDPKKFKNAMNDKQWLMYFFTYYNLQNK